MRFAIINSQSLKVVNTCEWEGAEWLPPFGSFVVQSDTAGIGDIYDPILNSFIRLDVPVEDPLVSANE